MKKKVVGLFFLLFILLGLLFLLRVPMLRGLAQFLIVETAFEQVEYAFVLSGGAFDRGNKAASLYHEGKVAKFVCTGGNKPPDIKALGVDTLESDLSKLQMLHMKVPDSLIILLKEGTSTLEESHHILNFCQQNNLDSILIISSKFHTRRIHQVFTGDFAKQGIHVFIQGAPSSSYDEMNWWQSEYGLIALNNEYLKQLYYLVKY